MNPPPPMFPAAGYVTASANPVAIAASTAFPPFASTSRPTSLAMLLADTTIPCGAVSTRVAATVASGVAVRTGGAEHAATVQRTPSSSPSPAGTRKEGDVIDVEGRSGSTGIAASRCATHTEAQFAAFRFQLPAFSFQATFFAFRARYTRADAVSPRCSVTSVISGEAPSRKGIPQ